MASSEFDRDFGYLMPFFQRVAAAASGLEDPAARAELSRLMSEEQQRWSRIRALLGGATGASAASPAPRAAAPRASPPAGPSPAGYTVGSLKRG